MQDNEHLHHKLDFDILIVIKPETDEIIYYSEFYKKKMAITHFAWFYNVDNIEAYAKLWYPNFDLVPFTIEGKKCMMPNKHFQYEATRHQTPSINDICQYLNTRNIFVTNMTQHDFQNYLTDYFMFPFFEKDRTTKRETLFEKILQEEARFQLRKNGISLTKFEFKDYVETAVVKDIDNLTPQEFKEIVVDCYAWKSLHLEGKQKSTLPTFVVMLEVSETINRVDKFLPQDWINRTDKLSKYKKAIFNRFGFDYAESTIKNNIDKIPTHTHRLKVIKMLSEYGFMNLAKQYQLQYKCTA